jgi:hypothetical protein
MSNQLSQNQTTQLSISPSISQKPLTRNEFLSCLAFKNDLKITNQQWELLSLFFPSGMTSLERLYTVLPTKGISTVVHKSVLIHKLRKKLNPINVTITCMWANGYFIEKNDFERLNNHIRASYGGVDKQISSIYTNYYIAVNKATKIPVIVPNSSIPRLWQRPEDAYDWLSENNHNPDNFSIRLVELSIY